MGTRRKEQVVTQTIRDPEVVVEYNRVIPPKHTARDPDIVRVVVLKDCSFNIGGINMDFKKGKNYYLPYPLYYEITENRCNGVPNSPIISRVEWYLGMQREYAINKSNEEALNLNLQKQKKALKNGDSK